MVLKLPGYDCFLPHWITSSLRASSPCPSFYSSDTGTSTWSSQISVELKEQSSLLLLPCSWILMFLPFITLPSPTPKLLYLPSVSATWWNDLPKNFLKVAPNGPRSVLGPVDSLLAMLLLSNFSFLVIFSSVDFWTLVLSWFFPYFCDFSFSASWNDLQRRLKKVGKHTDIWSALLFHRSCSKGDQPVCLGLSGF